MGADFIDDLELLELKNHCKVIKVFTDYDFDLENLKSL